MKGKNESEVIKRGAPEIIKSPAPFTVAQQGAVGR